ncbi:MAG: TlpA family protein disulfide reductase [Gammaproteobacteria bacterium]|nr:TlpA family protein disulfide reductase [Gammaproteobacteria bacterium]
MQRVLQQIITSVFCFLVISIGSVSAKTMTDFSGKPATIEQYTGKGKWTIVMFWASDCLICNKEARHYDEFHLKHKNKDAIVLGVSMDGQANKKAAEGFIKEHKLNFPNILGEPEDVAVFFYDSTGEHWAGTPTFLIYSPKGELKVQQIGAVPVPLIEEFIQQQTAGQSKASK